jgi:hypothetical protein
MKFKIAILAFALIPTCAFAVDGVVLINQSTVIAAGGFPYSISQPGSYKLSGNLAVPANISGILITVSNVTLDLNGFGIVSAPETALSFPAAVDTVGAITGITIRNGTITTSGAALIDTVTVTGILVEDLMLISAVGGGNAAIGPSAILRRVSFPTGLIRLNCQTLVVDSLAATFVRTSPSASCLYGFGVVVGQIF